MRRIWIALACTLLLAMPAAAAASHQTLPPGNSGADEYVEGVPGAGGDKPSGNVGQGDDAGGGTLPPAAQEALGAQGTDGEKAAGLAAATAPDDAKNAGSGTDEGSGGGKGSDPSGSRVGQVVEALTGSGSDGMGVVLPLILVTTVVVALALLLSRRRRDAGETA